ncbi:MAG: hypothetical protein KDE53_08605 [Caldilineaceae bacterium]|nr:hypothetical protein [Caldilineaceae bacterium]MCB0120760.1 hypothetical protein [Caldilineaceae bacterium]
MPRRLPEPLRLFHLVQSTRLSLATRLNALAELGHYLDNCFCQLSTHANVIPANFTTQDAVALLEQAHEVMQHQLLPLLQRRYANVIAVDDLTAAQLAWLTHYFEQRIYPLLTPLAVDPAHPFPRIAPKQLYFLVTLRTVGHPSRGYNAVDGTHHSVLAPGLSHVQSNRNGWITPAFWGHPYLLHAEREVYGLLNLAAVKARWITLPRTLLTKPRARKYVLWREEVIRYFMPSLFIGMEVTGIYQFRVLCLDQPDAISLEEQPSGIKGRKVPRKQMPVVHIDIEQGMPAHLTQWLAEHLQTTPECISQLPPPLDITELQQLVQPDSNQ